MFSNARISHWQRTPRVRFGLSSSRRFVLMTGSQLSPLGARTSHVESGTLEIHKPEWTQSSKETLKGRSVGGPILAQTVHCWTG